MTFAFPDNSVIAVCHTSSVAELHFRSEHARCDTNGPCNDGFLDLAGFDGLDDAVFFDSTDLAKEDEHLACGAGFISEEMIDEDRAGVAVTTNSDTFVGTICDEAEDVVEFVGHSSGIGDVTDAARAVKDLQLS
jgi:hypothetical protein